MSIRSCIIPCMPWNQLVQVKIILSLSKDKLSTIMYGHKNNKSLKHLYQYYPVDDLLTQRAVQYSQTLMRKQSITPSDAGCQDWLAGKLGSLDFDCHRFVIEGVSNLVAILGKGTETIGFAGHTDVVSPGPYEQWSSDPFSANVRDSQLIGRGAADMKTGIAAMLAATERFLESRKFSCSHNCFIWLITSDEEGEAEHGSKKINEWLLERNIHLDKCIVGEPTSSHSSGDTIKIGRRGALSAKVEVYGKQGHVAYPQYTDNAIHKMHKIVAGLLSLDWDSGTDEFPGTSIQVTHINSGEFVDNLVPPRCEIHFNIRYSHAYHSEQIKKRVIDTLDLACQQFDIHWERPCEPYHNYKNDESSLIWAAERAIYRNTGSFPVLSGSGGTSDGRFFSTENTQVIELGVPNKTIHQVDERVDITDILMLENIYFDLLGELLV